MSYSGTIGTEFVMPPTGTTERDDANRFRVAVESVEQQKSNLAQTQDGPELDLNEPGHGWALDAKLLDNGPTASRDPHV